VIPVLPDRLYNLLPAVYRVADANQGSVLEALVAVLQQEFQALQNDIDQLYENWFIETCDEWVVPYIGDLLGVQGLIPTAGGAAFTQRAIVANTLAYRRRKGTAAVLERLARDVSGWPAKAVEFFQLLSTTQNLNHLRLGNLATVNLRDHTQAELASTPFETTTHTAEVRHIDNSRGRYNIRNVGLFLWRLQDYAILDARAAKVATGCYTFNPLGLDEPLFNSPRSQVDITDRARERNVPAPLRRRALYDELQARAAGTLSTDLVQYGYFGDPPVLQVIVDGIPVTADQLAICDLTDTPFEPANHWRRPGGTAKAGVDPVLGRIALPAGSDPGKVEVSYSYGFSGDLGGGPYDRRASVAAVMPVTPPDWQIGVSASAPSSPSVVTSLNEAIDGWNNAMVDWDKNPINFGVIAIMDSGIYRGPAGTETTLPPITIHAGSTLLIVAADWPEEDVPGLVGVTTRVPGHLTPTGLRPVITADLHVAASASQESTDLGRVIINGVLIGGTVTVDHGNLGALQIVHATIRPTGATATLAITGGTDPGKGNEGLTVSLDRSISGPINAQVPIQQLTMTDSIVDAMKPDGSFGMAVNAEDSQIKASTILGSTTVRTLSADNTIFMAPVMVARRQAGCVRFSFLPDGSIAPRRFHCQPEGPTALSRVAPQFTSLTYGHPGYAQLAAACPVEISAGADDEAEMGAFHFLQQSRRLTHLQSSLNEYLRFGLEAGIFLVT
jgi:hypothetical protein